MKTNTITMTNSDDNEIKVEEISWSIINSYFDNKHLKQLVKHQIESFNHFIYYRSNVAYHNFLMSVNIYY